MFFGFAFGLLLGMIIAWAVQSSDADLVRMQQELIDAYHDRDRKEGRL